MSKLFTFIICGLAFICATPILQAQQTWQDISCGGEFSVAIRSDGTLWSWGFNANGQLGHGDTDTRLEPTQVGTDTDWASISAGAFHCLALKTDGSLWVWGLNANGQLGIGVTNPGLDIPFQQGSDTDWIHIEAGQAHNVAIKSDSSLWTWGVNQGGMLGLGYTEASIVIPTQVDSSSKWLDASAGGFHSLGIRDDASLWGWGLNNALQTGYDSTTQFITAPILVDGEKWIAVSAGLLHSMGIKQDQRLYTWGNNDYGQVGIGTTSSAEPVTNLLPAQTWAVAKSGTLTSYAINTNGDLYVWGDNSFGQAGITESTRYLSPIMIDYAENWLEIESANGFVNGNSIIGFHAIAYHDEQDVLCATGANYLGQFGDSTTNSSVVFECTIGQIITSIISPHISLQPLELSPNPAGSFVNISLPDEQFEEATVEFYTISGKLFKSYQLNQYSDIQQVDIQDLPGGMYSVIFTTAKNQYVSKLVVD